ncbi:MAG: GNAT family N-acetyltransferase [Alphaproteobacteria bacterium]|nr:GNAT family N-acetyltransferase [Alphaproteobacteria bacterium]
MRISNLNAVPPFKEVVADRIWKAWWRHHGHLLQVVTDFFDALPLERGIPFALVAHEGETYFGSVLAVASDLDDRPELSPWVAALWVEPDHRNKGIGAALAKAARTEILNLGYDAAFLCATAEKRIMYQNQGWTLLEKSVGEHALDVFELSANA